MTATIVQSVLAGGPASLVAKVTMVMLAAALAALALRGASAGARHLLWLVALGACVSLALVTPFAPGIAVPVSVAAPAPMSSALSSSPASAPSVSFSSPVLSARFEIPTLPAAIAQQTSAHAPTRVTASQLAVAVWLLGCLIVLARCVLGHIALARLARRQGAEVPANWTSALHAAACGMGLRRDVQLLINERITAPVTAGWLRPVILLPSDAERWSGERRRVVLVHELAHVARADYLAQLVATFASALFWFHPLVWMAAARLRLEAEQSADDRVLAAGTTGVVYASHLLEIARAASAPRLVAGVAVGIVRSSRLESRFRAMLDADRSRAPLSGRIQSVAASAVLAAMVPLAGLRAVRVPAPERPMSTTSAANTGSPPSTSAQPTVTAAAVAPSGITMLALVDSVIDKTVDAADHGRLQLDLSTGGSVVLHGWGERRVRMVARLAGRDWRDAIVSLQSSGGESQVRSRFATDGPRSSNLEFELWVPYHTDVAVSSAGGSMVIDSVGGQFTGHTGGGSITIEHATGRASLSTGGGSIEVANSHLDGSVSTGDGRISIRNVTGNIQGTSSGEPGTRHFDGSSGGSWTNSFSFSRADGGSQTNSINLSSGSASAEVGTGRGASSGSATSVVTSANGGTATGVAVGGSGGAGKGVGIGVCGAAVSVMTYTRSNSRTGYGGTDSAVRSSTTGYVFSHGTGVTDDGRVSTRLGANALLLHKDGGDIRLDDAPDGAAVSTGGGRIDIGSSEKVVVASTGGGDITLRRVGGSAVASTGAGHVTIDVVNGAEPAHSIDVCAGSGRVDLYLPAGIDASFELETAYTDNFARRTNIESDFPLRQSETRDWDDANGTPRKFVRATGVVGDGRSLIRVHTVNGDIVVHRR
jgi:beta-lactamase regulating signal transducer with metallopeptidase domain